MTHNQQQRALAIVKEIETYHSRFKDKDGLPPELRRLAVKGFIQPFPHDDDLHDQTGGMDPQCCVVTLCHELEDLLASSNR